MNTRFEPKRNAKARQFPARLFSCRARRIFGPLVAVALACLAGGGACAQSTSGQNTGRRNQPNPGMDVPSPMGPNPTFQEHRIQQLNLERQKEMVSETEKLLQLTKQLNADVSRNHSDTLTPDQLRTLEKIEKLAKSIKDKMTNPVQGTIFEQGFPPPMSPPGVP